MYREGGHPHQPPSTLYSPALGGHYCGPQQNPVPPPLVQSVKYFYTPEDNVGKTPQHHNIEYGVRVKSPPSILHHLLDRRNDGVLGVKPGT